MAEPFPLLVGLDPHSVPDRLQGNNVNLRWFLCNDGSHDLADVRVLIAKTHVDTGIEIPEPAHADKFLKAGEDGWLHTPLTVQASGRYALRVKIEAVLPDGKRLSWASRNEFSLPPLVLPKDEGRIRVNAEGKAGVGVYCPSATDDVEINLSDRTNAFVHRPGDDPEEWRRKVKASADKPDLDDLIFVELRQLGLEGLHSLDFKQIAATWPQQRRLRVLFVDDQQKVATEAVADGKTKYFVRLGIPDDGYVTILAKDDSGACCVLAPCSTHAESQSAVLRRGGMARFPRDETDPERVHGLVYEEPEQTQVLVFCSREPLLPKAARITHAGYPSLEQSEVISLIRRASVLEGTDIGWAKLVVKERLE